MAFIIDTYNQHNKWDREHATHTFTINGIWYAIKRVELKWGVPQLPERIDIAADASAYQIYETEADAMRFVTLIKSLN